MGWQDAAVRRCRRGSRTFAPNSPHLDFGHPARPSTVSEHALDQPTCPERIEHPRFVLRCRDETDAPRVKEVVDRNLEHLRRFMPWAWDEPRPVEEMAARLRDVREKFVRGEEWQFGIFSTDETRVLGAIGLHRGAAPGTMEIGFWLCQSAEGRGIATEATRILTNFALTRLGGGAGRDSLRHPQRTERRRAAQARLRPGRDPRRVLRGMAPAGADLGPDPAGLSGRWSGWPGRRSWRCVKSRVIDR